MKKLKTFELFGLGSKITVKDKHTGKDVNVGVGNYVVYGFKQGGENEGTFIITKILSNGNVLLKPASQEYQSGTPRDVSGLQFSPSSLVYYGKK
jgi:hypothetical protein